MADLTEEKVKKIRACIYIAAEKGVADDVAALAEDWLRLREERDKALADMQWMVNRAADERLDGYRELGARAAAAENERDALRAEYDRLAKAADEAACSPDIRENHPFGCPGCALRAALPPEKEPSR